MNTAVVKFMHWLISWDIIARVSYVFILVFFISELLILAVRLATKHKCKILTRLLVMVYGLSVRIHKAVLVVVYLQILGRLVYFILNY